MYKYRNLKKHCEICGIPPGGVKEFDHKLEGGGIELVEEQKPKTKITKKNGVD